MSDLSKAQPIPPELPLSRTGDAKAPDKGVPAPADDPAVADLADQVHANA